VSLSEKEGYTALFQHALKKERELAAAEEELLGVRITLQAGDRPLKNVALELVGNLSDRLSDWAAEKVRAEEAEQKLHALRLVCGTTDANKFKTAYDRVAEELAAEKARADANAHQSSVNAQAADNWRNEAAQLQERLTSEWAVAIERDALAAQVATLREALNDAARAIHGLTEQSKDPYVITVLKEIFDACASCDTTPETKHPDTLRLDWLTTEEGLRFLAFAMCGKPPLSRQAIDAARQSTP
jgi:hypothetical protein